MFPNNCHSQHEFFQQSTMANYLLVVIHLTLQKLGQSLLKSCDTRITLLRPIPHATCVSDRETSGRNTKGLTLLGAGGIIPSILVLPTAHRLDYHVGEENRGTKAAKVHLYSPFQRGVDH